MAHYTRMYAARRAPQREHWTLALQAMPEGSSFISTILEDESPVRYLNHELAGTADRSMAILSVQAIRQAENPHADGVNASSACE